MFLTLRKWFKRLKFRIFHYSLLPLRYSVKAVGLEKLQQGKAGYLFLCNHPSHLDPILVGTTLVKKAGLPVSIWSMDFVYKNPYAKFAARNNDDIRMLKVPNAHEHRTYKNNYKIRRLIHRTVRGLKTGENILFFPAGYQKFTPRDEINGKSAMEKILKIYPDVNIVLVKIHGMWGSRFSKAVSRSERSNLRGSGWLRFMQKMVKMLLMNGVFFIPKRKVTIEFVPVKDTFPRTGTRQEINQYIENFYNRGYGIEGEPLQKVPDFWWKHSYSESEYNKKGYQFDLSLVPERVQNDVVLALSEISQMPKEKITHNLLIDRDICLDSLEIADVLSTLEKKYPHCQKLAPNHLTTVGHLMALTAGIPVEYAPIRGTFAVVQKDTSPFIKAKEGVSTAFASLLGLFSSQQ